MARDRHGLEPTCGSCCSRETGSIRIIENGLILDQPFLDLSSRITTRGNEQGLLGLVFHPAYSDNGYFFVNYTDTQGTTVIARYQASPGSLIADPTSEAVLLRVPQPYPNHNGGGLAFGPDGFLYIGLGDGGSAWDPQGNAQNPNTLLGKMLRIDVNEPQDLYRVPQDNPFVNGGGAAEIWGLGLRNPWRFSFDRATGDLWIGDVGQNLYEEVNFVPAGSLPGKNFGWDYREGFAVYEGEPPQNLALDEPIWVYDHGQGCSVTGGVVYRGEALPEWQGVYLVADYCNGNIWALMQDELGVWRSEMVFETGINVSSFGQDLSGEVYILDHRGRVLKMVRR